MPQINEAINCIKTTDRGGGVPQLIVNHICDGTYSGTKAWFLSPSNKDSSSNFIVGQDGTICQCVPIEQGAWTQGIIKTPTSNIIKQLGGNPNQYCVSIEYEGYYSKTKGALTEAQLESGVWLIQHIQSYVLKAYGHTITADRDHIIGHCEINSVTRPNCPGQLFPWSELMARLNGTQDSKSTIYRAQVGAFQSEQNARNYLAEVKAKGYEAFLVAPDEDNKHWRVQVGAFASKANVDAFVSQLKKNGLEAFIVVGEV